MSVTFQQFQQKITKPIAFSLFAFTNLPSAWFAGLKIESLTATTGVVSVKQKWFNKNPFRSIYFAILAMAAEVATGVLCMGYLYKLSPSVSMLVVKNEAHFHKKATGKISFTCADGEAVNQAIQAAIAQQIGTTVTCHAIGTNEAKEVVAEFWFTWSFKAKKG